MIGSLKGSPWYGRAGADNLMVIGLYKVSLILESTRPLPLLSWSGVVAARIVKECIGGREGLVSVEPLQKEGQPLNASPSKPSTIEEPNILLGATLNTTGFYRLRSSLPGCLDRWGFRVISFEVERWVPRLPRRVTTSRDAIEFTVEYWPTIYMFRSRPILYPSPQRLVYSVFSALARHTGLSLKGYANTLASNVELLGWNGRVGLYSIGRDRKVRAFYGRATYAATARYVELLQLVMEAAQVLHVGKSRGIGFGAVKTGSIM